MTVGAGIISIITESLYDKPIVVFREYVQNSVDAFGNNEKSQHDGIIDITVQKRCVKEGMNSVAVELITDIFFLDNGSGIAETEFMDKMEHIADSSKQRISNIGYKGIGRLSGISYCQRLTFVNILSYKNKKYQLYSIDCKDFRKKKNTQEFLELTVDTAMKRIGRNFANLEDINQFTAVAISKLLEDREEYFQTDDTGFLVVMEDINQILADTVDINSNIIDELSWLLPVQFNEELKTHDKYGNLIQGLGEEKVRDSIPAKGYTVWVRIDNKKQKLERPITASSLRDYVFFRKFNDARDNAYAIALYSVKNDRIAIDRQNSFSGFKVYIDNMLLCDENELVTMLKNLSLTTSTPNELIQTVRGMGVMLYIVDKVNLSANARRTFIDVADTEAIDFLQMISDFIAEISKTRYALSEYTRAITKHTEDRVKLEELRNKAIAALQTLAHNSVKVTVPAPQENEKTFDNLKISDKKRIIKKIIAASASEDIKEYMDMGPELKKENAYKGFVDWFVKKYSKQ